MMGKARPPIARAVIASDRGKMGTGDSGGHKWLCFKGIGSFLWWSCRRLTDAPVLHKNSEGHDIACGLLGAEKKR